MGYSVKPALLGRDGQPLRLAQGRQGGDLWVENPNGKYVCLAPLSHLS